MSRLLVLFKWLLSFRKRQWVLDDYPLQYVEQGTGSADVPRWRVQVINWPVMIGLGETREQAYADLQRTFQQRLEIEHPLPRPGTSALPEFASNSELERYWGVAVRIIEDVLGFDPDEVFVSDHSSLWDFAEGDDISHYQARIEELFGVDVSGLESGNLAEISRYIYEKQME